jgi:hypothetical protein
MKGTTIGAAFAAVGAGWAAGLTAGAAEAVVARSDTSPDAGAHGVSKQSDSNHSTNQPKTVICFHSGINLSV